MDESQKPATVHPVLRFIYYFLKTLVRTSFRLYFSQVTFVNKERLQFEEPCILISNHPNTMMDPLITAMEVHKKEVFFLANYSLFKTPFQNWFFNTFYCIPVKRPQDVGNGNISNEDNFKRAAEHLLKGGCLYIAPEGASFLKRKLRPFKTGTARIAFETEKRNGFQSSLIIVPVGINYSAPTRFRSKVLVNVGEPVRVSDFKKDFEKDNKEAVRKLTVHLEDKMDSLVISVDSPDEGRAVAQLEAMTRNESPGTHLSIFQRLKEAVSNLKALKKQRPELYYETKSFILEYHKRLWAWNYSHEAVRNKISWVNVLGLILASPIALWGILNNIIPVFLSDFITRRLNLYVGYNSTVKLLSGLVLVPLFYTLQTFFVFFLSQNGIITVLYLLTLIPTGLLAWKWVNNASLFFRKLRIRELRKQRRDKYNELAYLQEKILDRFFEESGSSAISQINEPIP